MWNPKILKRNPLVWGRAKETATDGTICIAKCYKDKVLPGTPKDDSFESQWYPVENFTAAISSCIQIKSQQQDSGPWESHFIPLALNFYLKTNNNNNKNCPLFSVYYSDIP